MAEQHPATGVAPRMVDRRQAAAKLAARYGVSEACASAGLLIAEALRTAAAEYPDLTDAEAIQALQSIEMGVCANGVPRRSCACPRRIDGSAPVLHRCPDCGFEGSVEQVHTSCSGCAYLAETPPA
jgi:hypothetical protein